MYLRCFGVEACYELPLLDRCEVLLSSDDDEFMCPDCIGKCLYIGICGELLELGKDL